ncbi:DUF4148 domain-containing protein [Paraburkholderia hayleyella]|uniref:DUF4148 domain-containing protein n=1 Tax=Paraburkholderia hayleyella TaxID=2152889 RepID=UPI0012924FB1|nr:DUF4148 domain-containing protein [Paraburkholderia hayleyella]
MKSLISAVTLAALVALPVASFAQSSQNQPLTRAQVRAELVQLEQAGYKPNSDRLDYPSGIQAAEQRVSLQNGAAPLANSGYGAPAAGRSQSGAMTPATVRPAQSVYFGH